MNYRHAFHAGNFADVLKHIVLALVIEHLKLKPKPFRVVDTHAGLGRYRLDSSEAARTGEWRQGIGRLIGPDAVPLPAEVVVLLAPYLAAVARENPERGPDGMLTSYPGSPALALSLMRPVDRLVASELHPDDVLLLRRHLAGDARAKALAIDGWQALKSLLPPRERRGVVLVDPPFELAGEYERLHTGLRAALQRFATGVYLLWYPIKDEVAARQFREAISGLDLGALLWVELRTQDLATADKLAASGLAVVNPPFRLAEQLTVLGPALTQALATGDGAEWTLRVGE